MFKTKKFTFDLTQTIVKKDWHPDYTVFIKFDIQGTKSLPIEGKVGCEATQMRWK